MFLYFSICLFLHLFKSSFLPFLFYLFLYIHGDCVPLFLFSSFIILYFSINIGDILSKLVYLLIYRFLIFYINIFLLLFVSAFLEFFFCVSDTNRQPVIGWCFFFYFSISDVFLWFCDIFENLVINTVFFVVYLVKLCKIKYLTFFIYNFCVPLVLSCALLCHAEFSSCRLLVFV